MDAEQPHRAENAKMLGLAPARQERHRGGLLGGRGGPRSSRPRALVEVLDTAKTGGEEAERLPVRGLERRQECGVGFPGTNCAWARGRGCATRKVFYKRASVPFRTPLFPGQHHEGLKTGLLSPRLCGLVGLVETISGRGACKPSNLPWSAIVGAAARCNTVQ